MVCWKNRFAIALLIAITHVGVAQSADAQPQYEIAFASFAPLNTDLFIADGDGTNAKPFLAHPDLDANASMSSDGKWVVFGSRRDGSWDIYRAHLDGTGLERLTNNLAYDDQPALSPDGKWLAFVSSRSGQADIWILNIATKALRNLTNSPGGDFRPAWSPDGQRIAFTSDRNSTRPLTPSGFTTMLLIDLYTIKLDGSEMRRVTDDKSTAASPAWSADGKHLAFYSASTDEMRNITAASRKRGITQIVSVDLQTGARRTLTSGPGEKRSPRWLGSDRVGYASGGPEGGLEWTTDTTGPRGDFRCPSWSGDGKKMIFHREVGGAWPPHQKWSSLDARFQLVRTGVFPSFSPNGERMISNDQTAGILHNSILMMNADGSNRSVLYTHPDKSSLAPVWSWQGNRVVFGLGRFFQTVQGPASADIATINTDGSGFQLLTDGKSNYGFPSWSGDGRQVVYRESSGGRNVLHIFDTTTRTSQVLISGNAHYNFPTWSPTEDLIVFTSNQDGDYELYSIHSDGTHLKRLTNSPGNDAHSAWSPDGKWIAFSSARGGFKDENLLTQANPQSYGEIHVMRADGSDVRALTDDAYEEATPGWRMIPVDRRP